MDSYRSRLLLSLAVATLPLAVDAAPPDGARLFASNCAMCHSATPNLQSLAGPGLFNVLGRRLAGAPGYAYSAALTSARSTGRAWSESELDQFLLDPGVHTPGTTMPMSVPDKADRAALIGYLKTLKGRQAAPSGPGPGPVSPPPAQAVRGSDHWSADQPGRIHEVRADLLAPPFATPSAGNNPQTVARPKDMVPAVPPGFKVNLWASDPDRGRLLVKAPNGDLFMSSMPKRLIKVFRSSTGERADTVSVFASNLNRPFGFAFWPVGPNPQYLYVAYVNSVVRFPYRNGDLVASAEPEVVVPSLVAAPGSHTTRTLAFSSDSKTMYVSVGSASNIGQQMDPRPPEPLGAWEAKHGMGGAWGDETDRGVVLAFDPDGGNRRTHATGLRNCVGMYRHPATGDLFCSVNERDLLGDNLPPDYLTRVPRGAFFGWPWYYIGANEEPRLQGMRPDLKDRVSKPDLLVTAHSAPLGMVVYDAVTSAASRFPADYNGDMFLALHGSWNRATRTGSKVVRVFMKNGVPTGAYQDFATGFVVSDREVWGRPSSVAVQDDGSLLIVDDVTGEIWRVAPAQAANVQAAKEPAHALTLNGDWSFKYIAGQDAGADADFTATHFDASRWSTIAVPANWELRGFAEAAYADELKDGLGLYRREFRVPASWQGRRTFLRFEGVAFGYELWVNGKKAGASSASAFNRHTFDVTQFLLPGDAANTLAVRVSTKPLGYEFDLNDDWSLSGIYRDVTLFSVPDLHIADLASSTTLLADGAAAFSVDVALSADAGNVRARLIAPDGTQAAEAVLAAPAGQGTRRHAVLRVARPALWTAETPSLYRLQLTLSDQGRALHAVDQRVGLREVRIDGKVLLLNGRPIKLRGVNHHDLDPLHGRAITEAQMRTDLALMKKANVNFVRTSHYPPHVRLLELADEMGFYVMDEVSIGHGEKNLVKPEYRDTILARVEPTIARDRNHPSVLIWSIGNENPVTEVELEAGRLAKRLDPSRPITLPKIGSYFAANHQKIPDWVDIHAPHYPANARLTDYARTLARPTIITEYAHALGLATDRLQEQWETIQSSPVLAGGAVWHFMDQGILRTSGSPVDPSKPTQYAWLDQTRYYDTHGLDGSDGVVYADRTPQTDYWQLRKVYAPVRFLEQDLPVKPGRQTLGITVENRYDFRALRGIGLHWSLRRNGKEVGHGSMGLTAAARGREVVRIPVDIPDGAVGDVLSLQVRAVDESGMQINERSVRLGLPGPARAGWPTELPSQGEPVISEGTDEIRITLPQWVLTVQRATGALTIRAHDGKTLVDGIYPHSGRKPLMAEALRAKLSGLWLKSTLTRLAEPVITARKHDGKVLVTVSGRYPLPSDAKDAPVAARTPGQGGDDLMPGASQARADGTSPAAGSDDKVEQGLRGGYQLDIAGNGVIAVSYSFSPAGASGLLSEAGLSVVAPAGVDQFRWIGQGPYAGYPGKDVLNEFGLYHLHRSDLHFQGNRRGTELAVLSASRGAGFAIAMQPGDVAVERDGETTLLSHNALVGGLGNKGTTPEVTHLAEKTALIAGAFSLVPLANRWPDRLLRWLGEPAPARDVFKPFLHSYDQ